MRIHVISSCQSKLSEKAPWIIISLIAFVAAIPGLFLPETAGVNLPQRIDDIETFAKSGNFFWMPIMGPRTPAENVKEGRDNAGCQIDDLEMEGERRRDHERTVCRRSEAERAN